MNRLVLVYISCLGILTMGLGAETLASEQKLDSSHLTNQHIQTSPSEERYRKAARQGDAGAQYNLGLIYEKNQNYPRAAKWYEKAAIKDHTDAQYNLGVMYESGRGVNQDYKKAAELYEKAANQDHVKAQYDLGTMYEQGLGVDQDEAKAAEWYEKAARQGHAEAQHSIGFIYNNGYGANQDLSQAFKWWLEAAKQRATTGNLDRDNIEDLKELLDLPSRDQSCEPNLQDAQGSQDSDDQQDSQDTLETLNSEFERTLFLQGRSSFKGNHDFSQTHEKVSSWYGTVLQGINHLFCEPEKSTPILLKVNTQIQDKILQKSFPQVDISDLSLEQKQAQTPFIKFYKWEQNKTQHVFVSFEQEAVKFSTSLFEALDALEKHWQKQKAICEAAGPDYFHALTRRALEDQPNPNTPVSEEDKKFLFCEFGTPGFKEILENNFKNFRLLFEPDFLIQEYLKDPKTFQDRSQGAGLLLKALYQTQKEFQVRAKILIEDSLQVITDLKETLLMLLLDRHETSKENFNNTYPYLKGLLN